MEIYLSENDIKNQLPRSQTLVHHEPVLLQEAINLLNIRKDLTYIDATCGLGSHLSLIAQKLGLGKDLSYDNKFNKSTVIGIDQDLDALNIARLRLPQKVILKHGNFKNINSILNSLNIQSITGGILLDLGVSSYQLSNANRGFSFNQDGPLDMRMDRSHGITAFDVVNSYSEEELSNILYNLADETFSRLIARNIVKSRPLHSTQSLADVVRRCYFMKFGSSYRKKFNIHPATKTFQAIRIHVNQELECLKEFLEICINLLSPQSRLIIISFHSLEDRLVKDFFRQPLKHHNKYPHDNSKALPTVDSFKLLTIKPICPSPNEILANTRARSAKLRAIEKI